MCAETESEKGWTCWELVKIIGGLVVLWAVVYWLMVVAASCAVVPRLVWCPW